MAESQVIAPLQRLSHHFDEFLEAYEERYQPRYGFLRPVERFPRVREPGPRLRSHSVRSLQGGPPVGLLLQGPALAPALLMITE